MFRRTAVAMILATLIAAPAWAQVKIGVVNPAKILSEIKETKDANEAFKTEQESLKAQVVERQKKMQEAEEKKNQLKPDAPQWAELNKQIVQMKVENETWLKDADVALTAKFRNQAKNISDKIKSAISDVAKAKTLDLVLADQAELKTEELDRVPVQNLMPVLLSRSIYFRQDSMDITQEVIAKLDAGYHPAK